MRTRFPVRSTLLTPVAFLPALVAALLPKCPVCVAVYLSAAGIGAGLANDAAPWVLRAANGLAAGMLGFLAFRLIARTWRRRAE